MSLHTIIAFLIAMKRDNGSLNGSNLHSECAAISCGDKWWRRFKHLMLPRCEVSRLVKSSPNVDMIASLLMWAESLSISVVQSTAAFWLIASSTGFTMYYYLLFVIVHMYWDGSWNNSAKFSLPAICSITRYARTSKYFPARVPVAFGMATSGRLGWLRLISKKIRRSGDARKYIYKSHSFLFSIWKLSLSLCGASKK